MDKRLNVDREVDAPPSSMFIGLGYDKESGDKVRHYRRYFPDELENCTDVMPVKSPFHQFDIKKGQSRGASKGLLSMFGGGPKTDASGSVTTEQDMGVFKGVITIESEIERQ